MPKAGRPPKPETPLDEVQAAATVAAVLGLKKAKGWSDATINDLWSRFGETLTEEQVEPFSLDELVFEADNTTIYRLKTLKNKRNSKVIKGLYLWISSNYGNIYRRCESEEILRKKLPDIVELRSAFAYSGGYGHPRNTAWKGTFELYRPFHENPKNEIIRSKFVIGNSKHEFECSLESQYIDKFDQDKRFDATGKMVPWTENSSACILNVGAREAYDPAGHYIMQIYGPDRSGDEQNIVNRFRGLMISSIGPVPSAWPFFAVRATDRNFKPGILTADEYQSLAEEIKDQLDMGAVYWRDKDAPKAISQSQAPYIVEPR